MTTSHAASFRAGFGRWRAQRPFWGGLFLLLSGLELFLSANLELALEVHFGPTGFLSYVLPAMMLLCGLLTWLSPGQRLFYGILGTLTALYSLIGLNLGGFFLGTVLGVLGGGLAAAWSPGADPAPAPALEEGPPDEDVPLDEMFDERPTLGVPRQSSGVLTDELPTAEYSPLHGAGSADDEVPPFGNDNLPKRRALGPLLLAIVLAAAIAGATHHGGTAYAAPCGSPTAQPTARPSGSATVPGPGASPSAAPSPSASPSPTKSEDPTLLDWFRDLFTGGGDETAAASPSVAPPAVAASTAPAASPSEPKTTTKAPSKAPSCAPSSSPPNDKKAEVAPGQPHVAAAPSILKADVMTMDSLTYDGVAELERKDGSKVKVLAFSMKKSTSTPFELRTPGAPKLLLTKSSSLTVEGDVKFYTSKFSANVLGILPLTFTPSFPPPPIPLPGFYTNCTIELVYVQSNILRAPDMDIAYAT
ncbi:DUF6114 domain-containing protein [Dactylosporangium sp. AC04546]|uniref:DUF6114 domain-containing protein n=1 Tax=Dactylosporangium sp. AC04546 TaxID=2862460 RepID=UPI002E7B0E4E|nr:DUF6114 domain-containing protein [Dactylosporangium sp. AC04546]WVK83505.1 DUF6114 domain-containing protein [Dactylosporangium sp. AC04546]